MQASINFKITKIAVAIVSGLLTVFFVPWAVSFVLASFSWLPATTGFVHFFIGLAALVGVIAFWFRFFSSPPFSALRRWVLSISIVCGICSALSVLVLLTIRASWDFNGITAALLFSVFIGVLAIASLWLPTNA
ncbi:hypothetical protein [Trichlorobacter lovleyi]|uniref:hypothetical protein n=1 Tax=Trichlorobacter lovleyi TaxID=313985 RepID=UPI0012947E37|nr:hypothetical protein [Trichlorobacter lovleyi]